MCPHAGDGWSGETLLCGGGSREEGMRQARGERAARSAELKHLRGSTQLIPPRVHCTHGPRMGMRWAWRQSKGRSSALKGLCGLSPTLRVLYWALQV